MLLVNAPGPHIHVRTAALSATGPSVRDQTCSNDQSPGSTAAAGVAISGSIPTASNTSNTPTTDRLRSSIIAFPIPHPALVLDHRIVRVTQL
jgi:hypothetical protein